MTTFVLHPATGSSATHPPAVSTNSTAAIMKPSFATVAATTSPIVSSVSVASSAARTSTVTLTTDNETAPSPFAPSPPSAPSPVALDATGAASGATTAACAATAATYSATAAASGASAAAAAAAAAAPMNLAAGDHRRKRGESFKIVEDDRLQASPRFTPPSIDPVPPSSSSSFPSPPRVSHPNACVYKKMETLIEQMQDVHDGIPVRTVKSFISKIPSVFTGAALIGWLVRRLNIIDQSEAMHVAQQLAAHGYIFPIDVHVLTVSHDLMYYRFQTPFLWPSNSNEPDNYEYAVYLCKRTMQSKQRLELVNYEAENLARLQKLLARKWEFVYLQAEAQARVDKKRDRLERKVLDSQEQAFWDVHRPAPGCVNTMEYDVRKSPMRRSNASQKSRSIGGGSNDYFSTITEESVVPSSLSGSISFESLKVEVERLQTLLRRRRIKLSKVADSYAQYYSLYSEYDPFISPPTPSNPWISDSTDFWIQQNSLQEVSASRLKRWTYSLHELLKDPAGRQRFRHFLEKEFSAENLKFWEVCEKLKRIPLREVPGTVLEIYREYLATGACDAVNLDCAVLDVIKEKINQQPDRYCLDEAQENIFQLMKRDSYNRYVRLGMPNEFTLAQRKKSKHKFHSVRKLRELSHKISLATKYSEV